MERSDRAHKRGDEGIRRVGARRALRQEQGGDEEAMLWQLDDPDLAVGPSASIDR